jgi:hypothetical protein
MRLFAMSEKKTDPSAIAAGPSVNATPIAGIAGAVVALPLSDMFTL